MSDRTKLINQHEKSSLESSLSDTRVLPEHQEAKFQGRNDKNNNKKKYLIGGSIFAIILLIIILVVALKNKDDSNNPDPTPTPPSPIPEGFNIYSIDQSNFTYSSYMMTGVLLANASP